MLTSLSESVRLSRDCPGILIPAGEKVILPAGSLVTIKQSLGGDYTVRTDCGDIVRVAGYDADAIGRAPTGPAPGTAVEGEFDEENVWKALRSVYDPEIPLSIVELGLVYESEYERLPGGGYQIDIKMTLTAPGCGMGEVLKQDVEQKVARVPGVKKVNVELVFDPPWNQNRMSDAARLELGLF